MVTKKTTTTAEKRESAPAAESHKAKKQGNLTSALDDHGYSPDAKKWTPPDEYEQKKTVAIPAKNPNAAKKQ